MSLYRELRHEQTRQLIDVEQVFSAFLAAKANLQTRFAGSMFWREIEGRTYLYRKTGRSNRSLGARSTETVQTHEAFRSGQDEARGRVAALVARLNEMAPVNRALGLGRLPSISARILRRLSASGLAGKAIIVVGTTALFAYERQAAVQVEGGLLATGDIDLLYDARRRLRLAADFGPEGLLGCLRRADRSFEAAPGSLQATNRDGFMVDLVRPTPKNRLMPGGRASLGGSDDLQAVEIEGLSWLVNSPKLKVTIVDERGYPVEVVVPDPRSFALHKAWVSKRADREQIRRRRDMAQARLVARLVAERSALRFDDADLTALPAALRSAAGEILLPAVSRPPDLEPDW